MSRALPAIVGATATGKTAVAVEVARHLGGEVISVDSRQAYRGMRIGTAAPDADQLASAPHHGVAFLDPGERYGAGRFARLARRWVSEIEARGSVPILAGGSGLFLRALLEPMFREPRADPGRRARLRAWLDRRSLDRLSAWTRRLDPALATRLPRLDPQRAARALEVALLTGRSLSWWQARGRRDARPVRARIFVLELPAEPHRARIAERTSRQLDAGWGDEVKRLVTEGHCEDSPALDALGYREVLAWVRGRIGRPEAETAIVRRTWQYARRQRTWFRHQLPAGAVRLDARLAADQLAGRIAAACAAEWARTPGRGKGEG